MIATFEFGIFFHKTKCVWYEDLSGGSHICFEKELSFEKEFELKMSIGVVAWAGALPSLTGSDR